MVAAVVVAAVALWGSLAAWAVTSPVGATPDEDFHIASLYCTQGKMSCPWNAPRVYPCFAWDAQRSADCSGDRDLPIPDTHTLPRNYPPIYNAAMSPLIGPTVGDTVLRVRLVNCTLAVLLLVGSIALSRPSIRRAVALSWLVASIPLGIFIMTSVNPNSWAIMGVAALWGPLLTFVAGRGFRALDVGRAVFVLIAALMALGGRREPPPMVVITALAMAVFAVRWPLSRMARQAWLRLLLPAGLVVIAGLFLFLLNGKAVEKAFSVVTTVASRGMSVAIGNAAPPPLPGLGPASGNSYSLWEIARNTAQTFAAGIGFPGVPNNQLGWLDTSMPPLVGILMAIAFVGAVMVGLGVIYRAKAIALAIVVVGGTAFVMFIWSGASNYAVQPRYVLPLIFVFAGLALLPRLAGKVELPSPLQTTLIALAAIAAYSVAMSANAQRYLTGQTASAVGVDPFAIRSAASPRWWLLGDGLSPGQVWLGGTVAFVVAVTLGLALLQRPDWTVEDAEDADTLPPDAPLAGATGDQSSESRIVGNASASATFHGRIGDNPTSSHRSWPSTL